MHGRTQNEVCIILDEAQDASIEQMKLILTRIGYGPSAFVTGDPPQVDLARHQKSGLNEKLKRP